MATTCHTLENDGFELEPGLLDEKEIADLISELGPVSGAGERGLLRHTRVARLANSDAILSKIRPHLPIEPKPVRGIYFDKTPGTNWLVTWHQDLTLALREKQDVPGFGPWSTKEGIPHVQPPVAMLELMLTIRLHLDKTDESNGALRVLPGSHRFGRLDEDQIRDHRAKGDEHICAANAGDALLMRPLLLHASSRSIIQGHRRILHLEYAGFELPPDLEWSESASPDAEPKA
jgi:hypothetical protein